jgi:hypothetical protein
MGDDGRPAAQDRVPGQDGIIRADDERRGVRAVARRRQHAQVDARRLDRLTVRQWRRTMAVVRIDRAYWRPRRLVQFSRGLAVVEMAVGDED